MINKSYHH